MSGDETRRLRWRCRRGMKELDQVLVAWLERRHADATGETRLAFERLLESEDSDLWHWLTGQRRPDDAGLRDLIDAIRSDAHA